MLSHLCTVEDLVQIQAMKYDLCVILSVFVSDTLTKEPSAGT